MLAVGTKAPAFELPDQNGDVHTLDEYKGQKVVLYFYPRDNTQGCTAQACAFGDMMPAFREKGAVIVGVSRALAGNLRGCREVFLMAATLGIDVWHEKNMYGKKSFGVVRTTYLIDEDGVIVKAFEKVKAKDNPAQMLGELE